MFNILKRAIQYVESKITEIVVEDYKENLKDKGMTDVESDENEIEFESDYGDETDDVIDDALDSEYEEEEQESSDIIYLYEYQTIDRHMLGVEGGSVFKNVCQLCVDMDQLSGGRTLELRIANNMSIDGYDEGFIRDLISTDTFEELLESPEHDFDCSIHHLHKGDTYPDSCRCLLVYKGTRE